MKQLAQSYLNLQERCMLYDQQKFTTSNLLSIGAND
jgi:hypothetical protein